MYFSCMVWCLPGYVRFNPHTTSFIPKYNKPKYNKNKNINAFFNMTSLLVIDPPPITGIFQRLVFYTYKQYGWGGGRTIYMPISTEGSGIISNKGKRA